MMREGRVNRLDGGDAAGLKKFIASLFSVAAWEYGSRSLRLPYRNCRNTIPQLISCNTASLCRSFKDHP